jgi:hypothetical protein
MYGIKGYDEDHPEAVKGYIGPASIPKADSTPYYNGGGVAVLPVSSPNVTTSPPVTATASDNGRAARIEEYRNETGWDNIPEARALQDANWKIYIDTGSWSNPKQLENHARAEQIRKAANPMYTGRAAGPVDKPDADSIALPTNQFIASTGLEGLFGQAKTPQGASNIMGLGILAIMGVVVFSFFKG